MRSSELICESRYPSEALIAWVKRWVESSHQIEDQANVFFEKIQHEGVGYLNQRYPAIYRGLSVTDEQADAIASGETITLPAHDLQSWTKSMSIARDYALPGFGGNVGILVKSNSSKLDVVLDIENIIRTIGARNLLKIFASRNVVTDIAREREVVVFTGGKLIIAPKDVLEIN